MTYELEKHTNELEKGVYELEKEFFGSEKSIQAPYVLCVRESREES